MTFVYVPGKATELPCQVPDGSCCNCGATQEISFVETPLKKTRYFVLAGTELRFYLNFPYCSSCVRTADRFPVTFAKKFLVAFGIFWALMLIVVLVPNDLGMFLPGFYLPLVIGIVSLSLSFFLYSLRRIQPPQTSFYQPVTLKGLKQKFSGDIVGITLKFSNALYADKFATLNRVLVSSGALEIVHD